jgi:transcriptional regulator with XRE-family HTH domain
MGKRAEDWKADRGRAIVFLASSRGLNQKQLAAQAGRSDKTISEWTSGRSTPDRQSMAKVLTVIGCTEEDVEKVTAVCREWRLKIRGQVDAVAEGPVRYAAADDIERDVGRTVIRLFDLLAPALLQKRQAPSP